LFKFFKLYSSRILGLFFKSYNCEKELPEDLNNLRKIWKENKILNVDYLITGLYLFIEPKRSDYIYAKVSRDKKFIKIRYRVKVNVDSKYPDIPVPDELKDLLPYFELLPSYDNDDTDEDIKRKSHTFVVRLGRASKKIFGEAYSTMKYRTIWVSHIKNTDNDLDTRLELAKKMNHSLTTSKLCYERENYFF